MIHGDHATPVFGCAECIDKGNRGPCLDEHDRLIAGAKVYEVEVEWVQRSVIQVAAMTPDIALEDARWVLQNERRSDVFDGIEDPEAVFARELRSGDSITTVWSGSETGDWVELS